MAHLFFLSIMEDIYYHCPVSVCYALITKNLSVSSLIRLSGIGLLHQMSCSLLCCLMVALRHMRRVCPRFVQVFLSLHSLHLCLLSQTINPLPLTHQAQICHPSHLSHLSPIAHLHHLLHPWTSPPPAHWCLVKVTRSSSP